MAAQTGSAQPAARGGLSWRQYTKFGFIGIIVVLALVFIFENTQKIVVQFLWWNIDTQMWIVLLIIFVVGMLAGLFLGWRRQRQRRKQFR